MVGFLDSVAKGYFSHYKDISKLTFVMPNKRSGSFLLRSFSYQSSMPVLAPRIITISDLTAEVADLIPDSRLHSLFLLYDCYRSIIGEEAAPEFDKFIKWGDILLSDFNEIDMHLVDEEEIFKNIKDMNEIRANFLTEEQKEVAAQYFGYKYSEGEESFWRKFEDIDLDNPDDIKNKFLSLWQVFDPLYKLFKKRLEEEGLTTSGGSFRRTALRLEEGFEPFPGEKLIFTGFNALTISEREIFSILRDMEIAIDGRRESKADFVWDPVSEFLASEDDPAVKFVGYNMGADNFPVPEWLEPFLKESEPRQSPHIEVIGVPSNVMQVKVMTTEIENLMNSLPEEDFNNARVAMVLPDETLLLPLLYSLPPKLESLNLTMGFPLKHTSVVSFVNLLRRLQGRLRMVKGNPEFFFEDVKDFLTHPYTRILFDKEKISEFLDVAVDAKLITVGEKEIALLGPDAGRVFLPLIDVKSIEVLRYTDRILALVNEKLKEGVYTYLRGKIEKNYINTFRDALRTLAASMSEYSIEASPVATFRLAERMISGETVPFEGEPLQGLQVMGLLETRSLDFDYVLMPSMNDKIMPRRARMSTFIPNALRKEFVMPPANYQEEIFAYYFYRLAGRCKGLTLSYDARTTGSRNGGLSRYVLQLIHLAEKVDISQKLAKFTIPVQKKGKKVIEKNDEIRKLLAKYLSKDEKDRKYFSASALMNYCSCPVMFYFKNVMGIPEADQELETISSMDIGNIIHEVMERFYTRGEAANRLLETPVQITSEYIDQLLQQEYRPGVSLIEAEVVRSINHYHFHVKDETRMYDSELRGTARFLVSYLVNQVKALLRHDKTRAPFVVHGCEIEKINRYSLGDGRDVNMKLVIDRLDEVEGFLRIVDYKTGKPHLQAASLDDVFSGAPGSKYILQLALYADMLTELVENEDEFKRFIQAGGKEELASRLQMVIYSVLELIGKNKKDSENKEAYVKIGKDEYRTLAEFMDIKDGGGLDFEDLLKSMLKDILDPGKPFEAEPTPERCRYCDYKLRCELLKTSERENA